MKTHIHERFLIFPICESNPLTEIQIRLPSVTHQFTAKFATGPADYYAYFDALFHQGEWVEVAAQSGKSIPWRQAAEVPRTHGPVADPGAHFKAPTGWLNDPNGLACTGDTYHLFYQSNPYGLYWGNKCWGHAVSENLYDWRTLPHALYPDANGVCISGSAYYGPCHGQRLFPALKADRFIAVYTSRLGDYQAQSLAYSDDQGLTWSKAKGNPLLRPVDEVDFRDPKLLWHEETRRWILLLAAGKKVSFYTSQDLTAWDKQGEFTDAAQDLDIWECPDLLVFQRGVRQVWALVISVKKAPPHGLPGMVYFLGHFDGNVFRKEEGPFPLDGGTDFYAAITWPKEEGGYAWIGWLNNWAYAQETPAGDWRGMMTFPRLIDLQPTAQGDRLLQQPHPCLEKARMGHGYTGKVMVPARGAYRQPLFPICECILALENPAGIKADIVWIGADGAYAKLSLDGEQELVSLDRSQLASGFEHAEFLEVRRWRCPEVFAEEVLILRAFLDTGSLEVFFGDGQHVMTTLLLMREPFAAVEIMNRGEAPLQARELSTWQLRKADIVFGGDTA